MYAICVLIKSFFVIIKTLINNHFHKQSLQLVNDLFEMEWFTLRQDIKKDLLTIALRSRMPIEFNSAYIISMNLDSFVGVSINH